MQTIIDDNLVPFESDVVKFIQHVVEGLAYLHHRKIAHLDIKVGLELGIKGSHRIRKKMKCKI